MTDTPSLSHPHTSPHDCAEKATPDTTEDVIWKVSVPIVGNSVLHEVPLSARFVSTGWDSAYPPGVAAAVWFRVPRLPRGRQHSTQEWELGIAGTGHPFPSRARVLGTVTEPGFAWHVLDLKGVIS
jgi:hypothetical protein